MRDLGQMHGATPQEESQDLTLPDAHDEGDAAEDIMDTEQKDPPPELDVPIVDASVRLQEAMKRREETKANVKASEKCGATPKSLPKKPAAKVKSKKQKSSVTSKAHVLKKPAAKCQSTGSRPKTRELKMTRECVYSRAYHAAQCNSAKVAT